MKKFLFALLLLPTLAMAQTPGIIGTPPAVTIGIIGTPPDAKKMTMERAWNLFQVLTNNLNGSTATGPYKFTAEASWTIAVDISRLYPFVQAYQKSRQDMLVKISADRPEDVVPATQPGQSNGFKPNSAGEKSFMAAMDPLWQKEIDVDLLKIKFADLNIGLDPAKQNQIPPAVLASMDVILEH